MENDAIDRKLDRLKEKVISGIDNRRTELIDISHYIHSHPEIKFQEFKSSKKLADYLEKNGFTVERGVYGLETAFKASVGSSSAFGIGIMAEYDAVPDVGHGCGHNLIGTAAVGAGVALAEVMEELGGNVVVFGTPAEEGGNAKQLMAERGAFGDIDAAMMIHPFVSDHVYNNTLVITDLITVEYFGKTAHASQPERGINALDAMVIGYTAFKLTFPVTITPIIITKGGDWIANVPDHTKAQILLGARSEKELREIVNKTEGCFKAGAEATGARMVFHHEWNNRYRATYVNKVLADCFNANMGSIRKEWNPSQPYPGSELAATDMGSVSQIVPAIHPWIAIMPADAIFHTPESSEAAISDVGHKAMLDGAKAMAMTTVDLMLQPQMLNKAKETFSEMKAEVMSTHTTG
ncbi:MAG: amidohydrolase [Deltaproteobacteria bacterium]|nr:amidohydrolase [Deltaproteobacteria bacterium]